MSSLIHASLRRACRTGETRHGFRFVTTAVASARTGGTSFVRELGLLSGTAANKQTAGKHASGVPALKPADPFPTLTGPSEAVMPPGLLSLTRTSACISIETGVVQLIHADCEKVRPDVVPTSIELTSGPILRLPPIDRS
jgi:hypothetical protein